MLSGGSQCPVSSIEPTKYVQVRRAISRRYSRSRALRTIVRGTTGRLSQNATSGAESQGRRRSEAAGRAEGRAAIVAAPKAIAAAGLAHMPFANARRPRSEEHTSELQSHSDLVCRLLL